MPLLTCRSLYLLVRSSHGQEQESYRCSVHRSCLEFLEVVALCSSRDAQFVHHLYLHATLHLTSLYPPAAHNQTYKQHKNGIKKVKKMRYTARKGVSFAALSHGRIAPGCQSCAAALGQQVLTGSCPGCSVPLPRCHWHPGLLAALLLQMPQHRAPGCEHASLWGATRAPPWPVVLCPVDHMARRPALAALRGRLMLAHCCCCCCHGNGHMCAALPKCRHTSAAPSLWNMAGGAMSCLLST